MSSRSAGVLLIVGAGLFFAGAAIGVPRVFTQPDRAEKLRLLEESLFLWRLSQPLYAAGAVTAGAGVGILAAGTDAGVGRTLFVLSCVLLTVGALSWCWSVYLRAVHHREFALGELPGWPFATYVFLTIVGLALLGAGLLMAEVPEWVGWLTLVSSVVFLAVYLRTRDIPPFVFYLLMTVVGVALL